MTNNWHMVLSPQVDGEKSRFLYWITMTKKRLERVCPFASEEWVEKTVNRLVLESTQRFGGRPGKFT